MLPFELSCFGALLSSFADDNQKVLREHEGNAFSLVPKLLLFVVKEMAKVYVKQLKTQKKQEIKYLPKEIIERITDKNNVRVNPYLPIILHHNVAVVSVSYTQDKCGYTVACT